MNLDHDTCYRAIIAKDARFDGRFFTAVKTTGIYCRPVCPAKVPKAANVVFYPNAASAQEAGFRPCLRCRPETAPHTPAWQGTGATIGRAMRLIEEGALDDHSVAHLAMRLGIGERQLRRLFLQHVGASPIGVAQSRRVLLAKQLLHETQLSMAQVALGSGFGSIRRFNEVFQHLFGRPPIDIRRGITSEADNGAQDWISLKLRFRPPYDWSALLNFLRLRCYDGVEAIIDNTYCRSFFLDDHVGLVRVSLGGPDWLKVDIRTPNLAILPKLIAQVRLSFDLGADPLTISEHLATDEHLASHVRSRPGIRVATSWSGFEGVVRAILGQQITVKAAINLGKLLCQKLGARLPVALIGEGQVDTLFPLPKAVAQADLGFLPMPKSRQQTLQNVARAFDENPRLLEGSISDARARLGALAGIGPWTIDYVALRVLHDTDAFPATDVALIRAFDNLVGPDQTSKSLESHSQRWRPWRAYGAQHLWESLAETSLKRP